MNTDLRLRAAAILDALDYDGPADLTASTRADAKSYRRAQASKLFPALELQWAWSDNLDRTEHAPCVCDKRDGHPATHPTVFGHLQAWWPEGTQRPPSTMVLCGRAGPGKTVGAVWLAARRGGELLSAASLGELALASERRMLEIIETPVLVVDDAGDEPSIGPTIDRMRRIFKANNSTVLVTTNKTPVQFTERYGEAVEDRIRSTGEFQLVRQRSRRTGARPKLDGINRACALADMLRHLEEMTSACGPAPDPAILTAVQRAFGLSDEHVAAALRRRATWMPCTPEQRHP